MSVSAESHVNGTPQPSAFRDPDPTRARRRTPDMTPRYPPTVSHTSSRSSLSSVGPRRDPVATTRARCYDPQWTNTRLFFSERPQDIAKAKVICAGCELRDECLAGATERGEPFGVWGGECFHNGRIVETRRGRGRPRKERPVAVGGVSAPIPERSHAWRAPKGARRPAGGLGAGGPVPGGLVQVVVAASDDRAVTGRSVPGATSAAAGSVSHTRHA